MSTVAPAIGDLLLKANTVRAAGRVNIINFRHRKKRTNERAEKYSELYFFQFFFFGFFFVVATDGNDEELFACWCH